MMRLCVVLVVVTGTWMAGGCGTPAPVEQQQAAPAAASTQPSVTSPVSINASMVSIVDHAGHELLNVEREGNKPKTKEDWEVHAEHATQLAAAGALVRIPGTGVQDMTWVASPDWQKWARAMSDAAQAELKAIEGENFEALVTANGQLVEACEGCHKQFKPSLPSEGVVHAHAH